MNIEINDYGFCLDSNWTYIAISWKLITLTALVFIGYKIYKKVKSNKSAYVAPVSYEPPADNYDWSN